MLFLLWSFFLSFHRSFVRSPAHTIAFRARRVRRDGKKGKSKLKHWLNGNTCDVHERCSRARSQVLRQSDTHAHTHKDTRSHVCVRSQTRQIKPNKRKTFSAHWINEFMYFNLSCDRQRVRCACGRCRDRVARQTRHAFNHRYSAVICAPNISIDSDHRWWMLVNIYESRWTGR